MATSITRILGALGDGSFTAGPSDSEPLAPIALDIFEGRGKEWQGLDAALERATRFEAPQFVTVVGGAGTGKSRLLAEWLADVENRSVFRVVCVTCRRAPTPRPKEHLPPERFELLGLILRARFGLDEALDQESAMAIFRGHLQSVFGDRRVAEVAAFLGPFLGFELPESPLVHALAERPEQYAEVARAVLTRFLEEDARVMPLVVSIDDIDTADEASLELLARLGGELGEAPLMVVATARPELFVRHPEWGRWGGSHAQIDAEPLALSVMAHLAEHLVLKGDLTALQKQAALDQADGRPGRLIDYATRLRGGVVSAYWTREGLHPHPEGAPGGESHAAARIATLSAAEKELLARGTALGSVFWTGAVVALGRMGGPPPDPTTVFGPDRAIEEVRRMLTALEGRGYIMRLPESSMDGEVEWAFCHQAERAMLAGSVDPTLQCKRRLFAAQWIEGRTSQEQIAERFELLGNLYESGGDGRRAGECFVAAGDRALAKGRLDLARSHFSRGTRLLTLDDSVFKLDALHKLGDVAARVGKGREALVHFSDMLHIAWRLDLPAKGGAAHARIGRLHRGMGNYRVAYRHLELGRLLFELASDDAGVAACLDDKGRVHMLMGDVEASMACHKEALGLREDMGDDRGKALTLSWLGLCEVQKGRLPAGERCFRASLEISRKINEHRGVAFALMDLAGIERELGRPDRARVLLEEARCHVRHLSEPLSEAHLGVQIGECLLQARFPRDAAREFEASRELATRFGVKRLVSQALRGLAECKMHEGDPIGGRNLAEDALKIAEQIKVPSLTGAALRVMASCEVRGAPGDADRGGPRELFDRAMDLLSDSGAELELGRIMSAYAELEDKAGRHGAAGDLRDQAAGIRAKAWSHEDVGIFDRL